MNKRTYYLSENSIHSKIPGLFEKQHSKFLQNESQYMQDIYNCIIFEDFPIFPVPELLINDMIKNIKNYKAQKYFVSDIISKYSKNFDNYELFCNGLYDLQQVNKNAFIQLKYVDQELITFKAMIRSIDNEFNCELLINKKIINNEIILKTAVQHEIIHWLQTEINGVSNRKHGIWPALTYLDFFHNEFFNFILTLINIDEIAYLFSARQFEPYCSNACEYLLNMFKVFLTKDMSLTKEKFFFKFNECLNNFQKFSESCKLFLNSKYSYFTELLIFTKLCDLCVHENRYELYLKEVLFEHLKNN